MGWEHNSEEEKIVQKTIVVVGGTGMLGQPADV